MSLVLSENIFRHGKILINYLALDQKRFAILIFVYLPYYMTQANSYFIYRLYIYPVQD